MDGCGFRPWGGCSTGKAGSAGVQLCEHASRVVARLVTNQLVAAGCELEGDPAERPRIDAATATGPAAARRLAEAAGLVNPPIGADGTLPHPLPGGEREDDKLVDQAAGVGHPQRHGADADRGGA